MHLRAARRASPPPARPVPQPAWREQQPKPPARAAAPALTATAANESPPTPCTQHGRKRGRAIRLAAPTDRRNSDVTDAGRRDQFSRALAGSIRRRLWL